MHEWTYMERNGRLDRRPQGNSEASSRCDSRSRVKKSSKTDFVASTSSALSDSSSSTVASVFHHSSSSSATLHRTCMRQGGRLGSGAVESVPERFLPIGRNCRAEFSASVSWFTAAEKVFSKGYRRKYLRRSGQAGRFEVRARDMPL